MNSVAARTELPESDGERSAGGQLGRACRISITGALMRPSVTGVSRTPRPPCQLQYAGFLSYTQDVVRHRRVVPSAPFCPFEGPLVRREDQTDTSCVDLLQRRNTPVDLRIAWLLRGDEPWSSTSISRRPRYYSFNQTTSDYFLILSLKVRKHNKWIVRISEAKVRFRPSHREL